MKLRPGKLLRLLSDFAAAPKRKASCSAVLAAAGDSVRFGEPKPFVDLDGRHFFEASLNAFLDSPYIAEVLLAVRREDKDRFLAVLRERYRNTGKKIRLCIGGATRDETTLKAFAALDPETRFVAFHDAARALITTKQIDRVIESAFSCGAATAGCPVYDSVKRADGFDRIAEDVDRDRLFTVSTPQVFLKEIYEVARAVGKKDGLHLSDDNAYVTHAGFAVQIVPVPYNFKLTVPSDLETIQTLYRKERNTP